MSRDITTTYRSSLARQKQGPHLPGGTLRTVSKDSRIVVHGPPGSSPVDADTLLD